MSGRSSDPVQEPSDASKVVYNPESGVSSNYYGSGPDGDGPGHGHANVTESGDVTFNREPNLWELTSTSSSRPAEVGF